MPFTTKNDSHFITLKPCKATGFVTAKCECGEKATMSTKGRAEQWGVAHLESI